MQRKKYISGRASENSMKTEPINANGFWGSGYSTKNKNQMRKYKNTIKADFETPTSNFEKERIATYIAKVHNPVHEARARKSDESDRRLYETKQKIYSAMKKNK